MKFRQGNIALRFIYINVGVFLVTAVVHIVMKLTQTYAPLLSWLECPADVGRLVRQPWSVVTYMFMHGGFAHLFFNMFALWMFGTTLERVFGPRRFLIYYMVCGLGAGLMQELVQYI